MPLAGVGIPMAGKGGCGDSVLRRAEELQPNVMLLAIELSFSNSKYGDCEGVMNAKPTILTHNAPPDVYLAFLH